MPGAKTRVTGRKRRRSDGAGEKETVSEALPATTLSARDRQARVRSLLAQHIAFVERTLRRRGVPASELADQVQRTFIVAARRLESMHEATERPFLFSVALNLAARARRTFARRREVPADEAPEPIETLATPEHLVERKRTWQRLARIIDEMHESLRAVLILAVFEEMSFTDIAADLDIPRGTVASRLRRARQVIREQAAALERPPEGEV